MYRWFLRARAFDDNAFATTPLCMSALTFAAVSEGPAAEELRWQFVQSSIDLHVGLDDNDWRIESNLRTRLISDMFRYAYLQT